MRAFRFGTGTVFCENMVAWHVKNVLCMQGLYTPNDRKCLRFCWFRLVMCSLELTHDSDPTPATVTPILTPPKT